jgi:transglutaminase-like putative cysteine protease
MRLFIRHATIYTFAEPQQRLVELLRVTPSSFAGQNVVDWQIDVDCDARLKSGRDGHGNETTMLYVNGPLTRIRIAVAGEVLTDDRAGIVGGANDPLPPLLYTRSSPLTEADEAIMHFALDGWDPNDALGGMHRLMARLNQRLAFDDEPTAETGRTAAQAFAAGRGVCQDHAHVMIAAARSLGLPARYVSGHFWRGEDAGPQRTGHAWAEVYLDGYGWIGFDPVNDHCPDDRYVRVATGLDYAEAAPLRGARIGRGPEWMEIAVTVDAEGPRR